MGDLVNQVKAVFPVRGDNIYKHNKLRHPQLFLILFSLVTPPFARFPFLCHPHFGLSYLPLHSYVPYFPNIDLSKCQFLSMPRSLLRQTGLDAGGLLVHSPQMGRAILILCVTLVLFINQVSSAPSYHYPGKIVSGIYSDVIAVLMKRIWSVKETSKQAVSDRPVVKFESGYYVETVFDGTKLGVEPHAVEILPSGDLLILDSTNSNIYKISSSLSLYSRPKLIAGSAEGISGYVDGKRRDAILNHPMGITTDEKGNIYVADTDNMAIRKISETGVTTIAGGKWGRSGKHIDGPSEDAKFSSDFDLVYVGSSCSLLVIDRVNKAIREIQLKVDDCASQSQYGSDFPIGVAILVASCFFGYMLALLQDRVCSLFSSSHREPKMVNNPPSMYQKPIISVRPPLIPVDDYIEKSEQRIANNWAQQESFAISPEDEPLSVNLRSQHKTYPFMLKDSRTMHGRLSHHALESDQQHQQRHQLHHMHHISAPQAFTEQNRHAEFEFSAAQEQVAKRKKTNLIKHVASGRDFYNQAGSQYHNNPNEHDCA